MNKFWKCFLRLALRYSATNCFPATLEPFRTLYNLPGSYPRRSIHWSMTHDSGNLNAGNKNGESKINWVTCRFYYLEFFLQNCWRKVFGFDWVLEGENVQGKRLFTVVAAVPGNELAPWTFRFSGTSSIVDPVFGDSSRTLSSRLDVARSPDVGFGLGGAWQFGVSLPWARVGKTIEKVWRRPRLGKRSSDFFEETTTWRGEGFF